jgi:N-carbamoylputrescine amidase
MKVTVCELHDAVQEFKNDWNALVEHVGDTGTELVLLPEMPFYPWIAATRAYNENVWQAAVHAHEEWLERLSELAPAIVVSSRPVNLNGKRLNEGYVWDQAHGYGIVHHKYYLPDDEGFWEASWYERGNGDFSPINLGSFKLGMLICTEMWFMHRARAYGRAGVHIVTVPRTTGRPTREKWLVGGRSSSVVSGAFTLSSNHVSDDSKINLGGFGWITSVNGEVLGTTSPETPFLTVDIDLAHADAAKRTYPRYVPD